MPLIPECEPSGSEPVGVEAAWQKTGRYEKPPLPGDSLEGEVPMLNRIKSFLVSEDGPTATEYAVMLALIIIVALAAITALGERVNAIFTSVESQLPQN
jgi:pilus assembly protein Flp/PilA